ncbi:TRAP transporter small permease [Oceanicoccus sagamiensis]|uniref:TRAP transporter small permease protein n=1 Tax=Oceanicoccus sagamiensis TaxID=716816 RepID=A0A1X9N5S9_9GAMM|nr:TRAP transporter small permease [Oceanicoccus sagamiensis]ARN73448.1 hypothetical protein BST96_04555 [Oceanicoccus sagamiensis]
MLTAQSFLAGLGRLERLFCLSALAVLALVLFVDVMLRTFLGNGLAWAHQTGVYANIVVSMIGIGLASAHGSHLRPRFADHWLPAGWEPLMLRLQPLVTALLFLFFFVLSLQLVLETYALAELSTVLQTPVWPVQSLLPLAFGLACIRYFLFALFPELQPANSEVG